MSRKSISTSDHSPSISSSVDFQQSYRKVVNGIVPGYMGHVPNAKGTFGSSAHGMVPAVGPQSVPAREDVSGGIGGGQRPLQGRVAAHTQGGRSYRQEQNGIVPGYGGYVPGSKDKYGGSHCGGGVISAGPRHSAAS